MGAFKGLENYTISGNVSVAVFGGGTAAIAFRDLNLNGTTTSPHAYLAINGNLSRRTIDLGSLPQDTGSFEMPVPNGTDLSLFNTVILHCQEQNVGLGVADLP